MKMTKSILTMIVMLAAMFAQGGDSASFVLDTREERAIESSIVLPYDAAWIGGNSGATVVIEDNSTIITNATGVGDFTHTLTGDGRHELTYTTYIGGVAEDEVYTATVFKGWAYEVDDDGDAILVDTAYKAGDVVIPAEIDGHAVVGIAGGVFEGCSGFTSVTIPDSVVSIGDCAFSGCGSLTNFLVGANNLNYCCENGLLLSKDGHTVIAGINGDVTIPDSVTSIGDWAFSGCSGLTSVTIPDSVWNIGEGAFARCSSLRRVEAAIGLKRLLDSDGMFADCPEDLEVVYHQTAEISDLTAKQRRPWNGKVDITYTLTGNVTAGFPPDAEIVLSVTASNRVDGATYTAEGSALSGDMGMAEGAHHVVWDLNAQGLELNSDDVTFAVAYAEPSLYCVIDLSAGANATSYPVSYLSDVPNGDWSDEYKTTKLVLRRIEPGDIPTHDARITKPFYCGVFEVTQKQWELVMGSNPSQYQGDMRPVERVSYNMIRGSSAGSQWPASSEVDADSFMGRLRSKTGIVGFDLPTEAQWEYACRAGTTSKYNNGGDSESDLRVIGRYVGNRTDGKGGYSYDTTVGSYLPNAWGLYDMHGNVWETCLDWNGDSPSGEDPVGAKSGHDRVVRGGAHGDGPASCTSAFCHTVTPSASNWGFGFRLWMNVGGMGNVQFNCEVCLDKEALCYADSAAVSIDSRYVPIVDSVVVAWDASWVGGDADATVVIEDNGVEIKRTTGAGEFTHTLTGDGRHELTYTTYIGDVAQDEVYKTVVYKGKYIVYFESNGGEGAMEDCEFGIDMPSALPQGAFTKDGYFLLGWSLTPDGEATLLDGDSTADIVASDGDTVTLYAVWHEGAGGGDGLSVKYYDISSSGYSTWTQSEAAMTNYFTAYTPTIVTNTSAFGDTLQSGFQQDGDTSWHFSEFPGLWHDQCSTNRYHGKYASYSQNYFAMLYEGSIRVDTDGEYVFGTSCDDQIVIYVDGNRICSTSEWTLPSKGTVTLESGHHRISVATYENGGSQGMFVEWKKPGDTAFSPLPQAVLSDGNAHAYAVRFDANGGNGSIPKRVYAIGDDVILPDGEFTRDGWTLVGWAVEPEGPAIYPAEGSIEGGIEAANRQTVTLYARWAQSRYNVHFDANGGEGAIADESLWIGIPDWLSSNVFTRVGYTFAGWATVADGEVEYGDRALVTNLTETADETANLYAVWSPNQYQIKFNANGGGGWMGNQTLTYDAAASLTSNAFTKIGYAFVGWATTEDGEKIYDDGEEVNNLTSQENAIIDLYALWRANEYEVTFDALEGELKEEQPISITATFDSPYGDLPTASCEGYVFLGWLLDGVDVASNTVVKTAANHVLTAKWAIEIGGGAIEVVIKDGSATLGAQIEPPSGDLTIPSEIMGYPVIGIGGGAFADCSGLTSVTMPDSVASIGEGAFDGCEDLTAVTVPRALLGKGAPGFYEAEFRDLSSLDGNVSIVENSRAVVLDAAMTYADTIDEYTMYAYGTYMYFEGGITYSFLADYDDYSSVKVDETMVISPAGSACRSQTGTISFQESGWHWLELRGYNHGGPGARNGGTNQGFWWWTSNDSTRRRFVDPGDGSLFRIDTKCGISALFPDSYDKITSITLTGSITEIPARTFQGCSSLTEFTVPETVTSIGERAFEGCEALTSITIPDSVISIGDGAFSGCGSLTNFVVGANNLNYCSENGLLLSKDGHTVIAGINGDVTIPDGVKNIAAYAFEGCEALTSVTIPDSVWNIGEGAFAGCSSLLRVEAAIGLKRLLDGDGMFADCPQDLEVVYHQTAEISDVTAKQRYPWNGKVDITYTLTGDVTTGLAPDTGIVISVTASNPVDGATSTAEASALSGDTGSAEGEHHIVWDLNAQGLEIKSDEVVFSVVYATAEYCAIDLSGGANAVPVAIDSRLGENPVLETVVLPWNAEWIGGDSGATVVIEDNGVEIGRETGAGERSFTLTGEDGLHNLTYKTLINDVEQDDTYTTTVFKGWAYEVDDNGDAILVDTAYKSDDVVIPSEIDGYAVIGIADGVFAGCDDITSAIIPGNLLSSISELFPDSYDKITSITLTGAITEIPARAFQDCRGLTGITIPDSVWNIGEGAFAGCSSLRRVEAAIGLKRLLDSDGMFADCPQDLEVEYHQTGEISDVTARQRYPWNGKVDITYTLTGDVTAGFSPDAKIVLSVMASNCVDGATYTAEASALSGDMGMAEGAHHVVWDLNEQGLELKSDEVVFTVPYATAEYYVIDLSGGANTAPVTIDSRLGVTPMHETVVLPWNAEWIGGDSGATVVITDNGTEVKRTTGSGEFEIVCDGRHELTYTTYVDGLAQDEVYSATVFKGWAYEVDDNGDAFLADTAYKSGEVVIPSEIDGHAVIGIADGVFAGCDGITSATIPGNLLSSISELFPDSYDIITSITLTDAITEIPERAFHGCCSITGFTVPETVTSIGECAFEGCEALTSVTIPDSVKSIGASAFDGCNIPSRNDGYKVIDGWVIGFSDNAQFKISNVDSIRGVADGALEGCRALKDLSFTQDSVLKAIGVAAFKGCTELKTMMLPPSLEEIGNEAFVSCSYLGNVIVPSGVKHVGDRAFKNCTGFTAAQIAYGVESLGEEAFYGDWRISEVDIPSTVTNIGVNAFGGDSSIIRIGLRGDVRKASEIFSNYRSIREATVKEGDGEIVDGLFSGFSSLQDVHFLGNCPALANDGQLLYMNTPDKTVDYGGGNVINALVTYVEQNSTGWDGTPGSHSLPQAWPLTGSYRRSIAWWDSPTYLCQFDSNGGTLGVQDTYQYSEKTISLPPEPVQTGYTFAGWWTQPVGGLRVTADTIFIEGVYTRLYAHWIKGHWVFLDPNGGTVVNDFVTYVEESVYGVLPVPVRSGYSFGGWLYNGYKIEPETEINEKADHTLVAQWTANLYSVRYNANGGDGGMAEQGFVYGVEQELRKNLFARSGYEFIGWATNAVDAVGLEEETDAAVYADCESVTNLTAVADGWIELFAVWKESDVLPDPSNLDFHFSGDAKWELRYEGVAVEKDGETLRYATVWRSGSIANNQKSVLVANVYGAGKIGFWWKVSCESFRDWKLDNLEFAIDGVAQVPWINGEKDWAYVEFEVETSGAHTLTWAYSKDEEGSDGEDCGWITAAVWAPKLESLGDYVNCPTLEFSSSGNSKWQGDKAISHDGIASLRSGAIGDGEVSTLETEVEGAGRIGFWWKVSSEAYRTFKIDYVSFSIDDVEQAWMGGEIGWTNVAFDVVGSGTHHTLRWEYRKDDWEDTKSGEDCAWLDEVVWTPKNDDVAYVTVPDEKAEVVASGDRYVVTAKGDEVLTEGDFTFGAVSKEAYKIEIAPDGKSATVTLAAPEIAVATEQEADDGDPSGLLANVDEGAISAKPEPEAGETLGALPVMTYPGLYYQASWGDDLGDMTTGVKVQATGEKLYLGVIKQTGDKGFYKISVSEE